MKWQRTLIIRTYAHSQQKLSSWSWRGCFFGVVLICIIHVCSEKAATTLSIIARRVDDENRFIWVQYYILWAGETHLFSENVFIYLFPLSFPSVGLLRETHKSVLTLIHVKPPFLYHAHFYKNGMTLTDSFYESSRHFTLYMCTLHCSSWFVTFCLKTCFSPFICTQDHPKTPCFMCEFISACRRLASLFHFLLKKTFFFQLPRNETRERARLCEYVQVYVHNVIHVGRVTAQKMNSHHFIFLLPLARYHYFEERVTRIVKLLLHMVVMVVEILGIEVSGGWWCMSFEIDWAKNTFLHTVSQVKNAFLLHAIIMKKCISSFVPWKPVCIALLHWFIFFTIIHCFYVRLTGCLVCYMQFLHIFHVFFLYACEYYWS